ncbi:MAG: nucleotidyltransferase domain-containing protein [Pseudomonadota bacterium]
MSYKFSLDESRALRELKDSLKEFLGDRIRLVLYGSRARGDYVNESDIDIAVIVRNLNRELKNQILDKIANVELKYLTPLSTLVLSEDDFTSLKNRERRIAMDIEKEGIPL